MTIRSDVSGSCRALRLFGSGLLVALGAAACFDLGTDRSGLAAPPGLTAPCYTGDPAWPGVGECRLGFNVNWADENGAIQSICFGEILPAAEICNDKDDDCDGATDNQGACAGEVELAMVPPGVTPFTLQTPDRVGPLLVKQRGDGALAVCSAGESFLACAERFVRLNGTVYGADEEFGVSLEATSSATTEGHATVRFRQLYRGIPVHGGGLAVHLRTGTPVSVQAITAHVLSVRADLPTEPAVPDALAADFVAPAVTLGASLVVWTERFRADGTALPLDEQTQYLAWRLEVANEAGAEGADEVVLVDAMGGRRLGSEPLVEDNVAVFDASDGQLPDRGAATPAVEVPFAPGGAREYPLPDDSPTQRAARAGYDYLVFLAEVLGIHALDGRGTDLHVLVQERGTVRCGNECVTLPAGRLEVPQRLGYFQAGEPHTAHVCCLGPIGQADVLDTLEETVLHELSHGLVEVTCGGREWHCGMSAPWGEVDATRHAIVEAFAEMVQCRQRGLCDWQHARARDYVAFADPGSDCGAPGGSGLVVENVADPNRFTLCPEATAGFSRNRLVPGYALRLAGCLMAPSCSLTDCAVVEPACGAPAERLLGYDRLALVLYHAVRDYLRQFRLLDLYAALVQACVALAEEPSAHLSLEHCAAIQQAFEVAGIAHACQDTLAADFCDGVDNDCDGYTDNVPYAGEYRPLSRICWTGPAEARHVGTCADGTDTCRAGRWSGCEGQVLPTPNDLCGVDVGPGPVPPGNGRDEDCDRVLDEGCGCQQNGALTCGPENGDESIGCRRGIQECRFVPGTGWIWDEKCQGAEWGGPEICDGQDNDCDTHIDEDLQGLGRCGPLGNEVDPATGSFVPLGHEVCRDATVICDQGGHDYNGCGGGAVLPHATGSACATADGKVGLWVCDGPNAIRCIDDGGLCIVPGLTGDCAIGLWDEVDGERRCRQSTYVRPETCDRRDNDCDGSTDEGHVCEQMCIVPGAVGECAIGHFVIRDDQTVCLPLYGPAAERCDDRDNDCDGPTDEADPPIVCGVGGCQRQVTSVCSTCVPGSPVPEACFNGVDDDCDGQTDEYIGTEQCFNGIDDDCDGQTDEYLNHEGSYATDKAVVAAAWSWSLQRYGRGLVCEERDGRLVPATLFEYLQASGIAEVDAAYPCTCVEVAICQNTRDACDQVMSPCEFCQLEVDLCWDGIDNNCDGCVEGYPCNWEFGARK